MKRLFTRRSINPMAALDFLISGEYKQYLSIIIAVITALGIITGGTGSSGNSTPETPGTTQTTTSAAPTPETPANNGPFKLTAQKRPTYGYIDHTSVAFAGEVYPNSINNRGYASGTYVEYNLSNEFKTLRTVIGIDDNVKVSNKYGILKFYLDGRLVKEDRATFAKPHNFTLDVNGATRLRIEFFAYENGSNKKVSPTGVALGDPGLYR